MIGLVEYLIIDCKIRNKKIIINNKKQTIMQNETGVTQAPQATPEAMTFGMKLVGISFNPSGDAKVNRAKELCAALADLVMSEKIPQDDSKSRYLHDLIQQQALGEILNAQMNVVKLLTLKY